MVHRPAPIIVTVEPVTVQTKGVAEVNVTANPELAVADTANGDTPKVCPARGAKVIVCVWMLLDTVNDC